MKELVKIEEQTIGKEKVNAVDARELWKYLESKQDFSTWAKKKIVNNPFFQRGIDWDLLDNKPCLATGASVGGHNKIDYNILTETAIKIAIDEKTEKGMRIKNYLFDHMKTQDGFIEKMMKAIRDIDLDEILEDIPEDGYKRYVYVAKEEFSGRIKIGISKDPEQRIKALNTGNPEELILVTQFEAKKKGYQSERDAHLLLKDHKIRGEWFDKDTDYTQISKVA